jgi:cardiolipin hydrolase
VRGTGFGTSRRHPLPQLIRIGFHVQKIHSNPYNNRRNALNTYFRFSLRDVFLYFPHPRGGALTHGVITFYILGGMSQLPDATSELLQQFKHAFADSTLSLEEARQLRQRLAEHGQHGDALHELRHRLFGLARDRFNSFQDKAVVEWLEAASALLLPPATPPARTSRSEVYFSPHDDCVGAIRRFLNDAAHRLDICLFTIAGDRLTSAVLAAHRRGVRVRLLTDNDKLYDQGSDVRQLHAAGLPVRVDRTTDHMHHKFAIADNRTVLTGSYNWTRSAAELNQENLLITDDEVTVRRYAQEFGRLWEALEEFEE